MKTHNIFPVMFLLDGELNLNKGGRLSETCGLVLDCAATHRAVHPLQASSPAVLSIFTEPCGHHPLWTWDLEHTIRGLLCLASCLQHRVFRIHPCCAVCGQAAPFRG